MIMTIDATHIVAFACGMGAMSLIEIVARPMTLYPATVMLRKTEKKSIENLKKIMELCSKALREVGEELKIKKEDKEVSIKMIQDKND